MNVRAHANEDSKVMGKLYDESVGTVLKKKDGWYKIKSGNVTGFVKADYVKVGTKKLLQKVGSRVATVDTQTLRVREKANGDSKVIELVPEGEELTVVSESKKNQGWVKVTVEGGDGYVSADYVTLTTQYTYAESREEEKQRLAEEEADRQAAAAAAAISSMLTPYPALRSALDECGSDTPKAAYTDITNPEQSAPFVRLVPP